MQKHEVTCATDITGFGLLGHAMHIARASRLTLTIDIASLPVLPGVRSLIDLGCIPGGAFHNQKYIDMVTDFAPELSHTDRLLTLDPQTSGGLLMLIEPQKVATALSDLHAAGYVQASVIGSSESSQGKLLRVK